MWTHPINSLQQVRSAQNVRLNTADDILYAQRQCNISPFQYNEISVVSNFPPKEYKMIKKHNFLKI